ncbi:MAG: DUF3604 domain-containing protein, partial [Sphaerochaetaceae bacterium]|nr:DUF3604 domain-containing protein [Sphaerochaetaceae bacterium]
MGKQNRQAVHSASGHQLYWGDIHNHNAVGYAKGSLGRTIEIAREHLDFFAFTGHAYWHDMPIMPGDRHMVWVNGSKVHSAHWDKTRKMVEEANDEGFVSMIGYEWHSSTYGDFCLIFPKDQPNLYLPDNVKDLFDFARNENALAIPHHVGYKLGWRGANWSVFDPSVTPVVEIFSEHGCTETDRSHIPMILHSNGGCAYSNSLEYNLKKGLRFGFVASTDDHFGYPGAYGEGLVAIWSDGLSKESIFEAIRNRRTYAVTGDRIMVDFMINGNPMGSELPASDKRDVTIDVVGEDAVQVVELIKNGKIVHRAYPDELSHERTTEFKEAKCRIQYGWGPWAALDLARTCNWDMDIEILGGRLKKVERCFQAGPYEETLRDKLTWIDDRHLHLESFTSRKNAYLENPTKSIILSLEGDASTRIKVKLTKPHSVERTVTLEQLVGDNDITFTDVFTSESFVMHRLVFPFEYEVH